MANSAAALIPLVEPDNIIPFPRAKVKPARPPRRRFGASRSRAKRGLDISFPGPGEIAFHSGARFATWNSDWIRKFIETSFSVPEIREVEIDPLMETATLRHEAGEHSTELLQKLGQIFQRKLAPEISPSFPLAVFRAIPKSIPRLRVFRHGTIISTWEARHEVHGLIRLRNPLVLNKPHLVQRLERGLLGLPGVDSFRTQTLAGSLTVEFNPQVTNRQGIVAHLDTALAQTPGRVKRAKSDHAFSVATVSLFLSAWATFVVPPLRPLAMVLMLYTAVPSFQRARRVLQDERRLGVDVLDSIIFIACSLTGQVFAGAMTAWFLNLGRKLLLHTQAESEQILLQAFGKQATVANVLKDGREIETPLEKIQPDDLIVIHTGEAVPVDGVIAEGDAILDQHALTGESAPAEKTVGDKIFASTLLLAGKIVVRVEKAGKDTAASKISEILTKTVAYKLDSQSRGERMADQAVIPTLGLAAVASTLGPSAALAVINSEMGTGIRMAAPLGMLTSLTLCAQNGILVKDGRALEIMRKVDTVLFDKTGTLTREKPEVGRILCHNGFTEEQILTWAAAAEQKFSHPIARAILERYSVLKRPIPALDSSKYKVGYGITVELEGKTIRVGSRRFLEHEKISMPPELQGEIERMHGEGHSFVCVAVEGEFAGLLELQTSHRPEIEEIVAGLRARGVNHMAIISGDHEQPTRRLAQHLGMDRHFAEVLPQDKAKYVELLQKEGRTVCFIGDGINDSIALKKANVSISLRGASSIATDTAQIVFMEESLAKVCDLIDYSHALETNVNRSWNLIAIPNGICIAGVFLFGFNIWHSVAFNNISAIAALINGMLPLRRAAKSHFKREQDLAAELEIQVETTTQPERP
jgi:Cu2+-exporting ATPase